MADFTFHAPGEAWTPAAYAAAVARGQAGPRPRLEPRLPAAYVPPKPRPGTGRISGAAQRAAKSRRITREDGAA